MVSLLKASFSVSLVTASHHHVTVQVPPLSFWRGDRHAPGASYKLGTECLQGKTAN